MKGCRLRKYKFIITAVLFICGLSLWDVGWIKADDRALTVNDALNHFAVRDVPETQEAVGKKRAMIDVLDLKNADIIDVLKIIAEKSGLNIMAGRSVKGRVSMYFKNIDVMDALQVILDSHGLAFFEEEGIVRVMTEKDFELKYGYRFGMNLETTIVPLMYADAQETAAILTQMKGISGQVIIDKNSNSIILKDTRKNLNILENIIMATDVPLITRVFELTYGSAEALSDKISGMLTQNIGRVVIDERSNKIIVTDIAEKIYKIAAIINVLDEKEEEVLIEAKIVQVVLSDDYKMGVDWEAVISNYHGMALTGDFDILESSDKRGKLGIGTLADDNYTVLLTALEMAGTTNILSNPRITVLNNNEAKILVGSTEPYITSTTVTPASGATTTSESVNFIEVGVKLHVTPTIHRDGFITMKIRPEVSSVVKMITTSNNNTIPVVETSEAETTVMIKDGATIVIGGLIKDENIRVEKKVPLLGDIPFLGMAFRSVDDSKEKTELVIFLTPRIISGEDEPLAFDTLTQFPDI